MPMLGRADSLNAAVAGAVLASEALAHLRTDYISILPVPLAEWGGGSDVSR